MSAAVESGGTDEWLRAHIPGMRLAASRIDSAIDTAEGDMRANHSKLSSVENAWLAQSGAAYSAVLGRVAADTAALSSQVKAASATIVANADAYEKAQAQFLQALHSVEIPDTPAVAPSSTLRI
jgi:uncharacterized protein YukE